MELSNRTLAFLVILAITLSTVSTISLLNKLQMISPRPIEVTGKLPTASGEINLTIQRYVSIILHNSTIDFGAGIVNDSKCNNATVQIEWDGGPPLYTDVEGCWINTTNGQPTQPTHPFTIENDGNENVTLTVQGPHPTDFFTGVSAPTAGTDLYNLSWRGENMDFGCSVGIVGTWTAFNGTEQTICDNNLYGFIPTSDDLAVNIQVQIPAGGIEKNREYKNDSIVFTASVV